MDNGTETESDDDDPESVESDGPHDVSNLYFTENIYLLHIISDFFFYFLTIHFIKQYISDLSYT